MAVSIGKIVVQGYRAMANSVKTFSTRFHLKYGGLRQWKCLFGLSLTIVILFWSSYRATNWHDFPADLSFGWPDILLIIST